MASLKLTRIYLFFVGYPAETYLYVSNIQENEPGSEKKRYEFVNAK